MHAQLPSLRPHLATLLLSQITALQFFCSVLLCAGALMAFGPVLGAQTLPVVGQVLWKIDYTTASPTGAIAYAPTSDLVFAGTDNGFFLVVKGSTGEIVDTVWTTSWRLKPSSDSLSVTSDLSCSNDGSVIAITVRNNDECKVVLMEYPSKRILMDSLYVGLNGAWQDIRIKVSPSGRYVVVPNQGNVFSSGIRLHDRVKDTMYLLSDAVSHYKSQPDFDDAERTMVYNTHGFIEGITIECRNRVSVLQLNEFPLTPRHLKEYGRPSISSDGRYLMISGFGMRYSAVNFTPIASPRSSVYDMLADSLIWRINGDLSGDNDLDLTLHQWSKDATKLYAFRDSKKIPTDWRTVGVFYRVGDSIPYKRPCDECGYSGAYWNERYGSIASPDLSVGFACGTLGLYAISLTPTTSVADIGSEGTGIVYPNPTTGEVRLRCTNGGIATSWNLVSINGQQLAQGVLTTAGGAQGKEGAYSIILSKELPRGTYLLSLLAQRGTTLCTQKVVLQ